jgi:hypothetical protein
VAVHNAKCSTVHARRKADAKIAAQVLQVGFARHCFEYLEPFSAQRKRVLKALSFYS